MDPKKVERGNRGRLRWTMDETTRMEIIGGHVVSLNSNYFLGDISMPWATHFIGATNGTREEGAMTRDPADGHGVRLIH